jgi:hypothetical protein
LSTSKFSNVAALPPRKNKLVRTFLINFQFQSNFSDFNFNFNLILLAAILPVVQKQHQLLVTLLLCNAASMEVIFFGIYVEKNQGDVAFTSN